MHRILPLIAALFGLGLMGQPAAARDAMALAAIAVEPGAGAVTIVGQVVALAPGRYGGRLTVDRSGASGTVTSKQGGSAELRAGEVSSMARVDLSLSPGDGLEVSFVVLSDGVEIASSKMTVTP
ncbi:curli-like amyloid fiber formation chaperone CsgH [Fulvimarina sp. 2208YS6-2-32]|uniref:Curli-like amyloid fiber formation chaperone CsgH n=1 Tax=Fulvimarina uroteuthidis TaxID=3098149 RepID=A0ABU5HYX1_9HYPH|nr:curli-like amyloid fiber formation chaperone CsgH [Fulvimarina sp. 2208YS6-2-32]MDY8108314.1 curli-like amyloid fiber formation chaperone CsgH [Fulvimarina sp. 2208YS6-2-32]